MSNNRGMPKNKGDRFTHLHKELEDVRKRLRAVTDQYGVLKTESAAKDKRIDDQNRHINSLVETLRKVQVRLPKEYLDATMDDEHLPVDAEWQRVLLGEEIAAKTDSVAAALELETDPT